MINIKRVLKASLAWTNIAYIICYFGVMIFPALRNQFLQIALHFQVNGLGQSVFTVGNFIGGLVWWNVIAFLGMGLFAILYNKFRD